MRLTVLVDVAARPSPMMMIAAHNKGQQEVSFGI